MAKYIGCKLIEAEPMTWQEHNGFEPIDSPLAGEAPGYRVKYTDGYTSWSPKEVFEKAYLKVTPNPVLKSGVSISPDMVDAFIANIDVSTIGEKTTLVRCTLVNGFEIVESSACVDVYNYSERLGAEVCMKKIKDKIWYLLGFLLQTAYSGIKTSTEGDQQCLF